MGEKQMTKDKQNWEERYLTGDLPWDSGYHDKNIEPLIKNKTITPCSTLELGCGTGTNSIWMAKQGFEVTASDISEKAIAFAKEKALNAGVDVNFCVMDLLRDPLPSGKYEFVFDRGCFHSFAGDERDFIAKSIYDCLMPGKLWFSMMGSADCPPRKIGPPQLSVQEISKRVEPFFEIKMLKATHFDSSMENPPPAWACLMQKRG